MKICAIIITYYPDLKLLSENISRFVDNVDSIIIWDNTPEIDKSDLEPYAKLYNAKILGNGKNVGIAVALNFCVSKALETYHTHILTMDQDSLWENFIQFKRFVIKHGGNDIIGPSINNGTLIELKKENHIITSGTIMPIKTLQTIGGYCESLFVDGIDLEVCDRARKFGFKVYSTNRGQLRQKFGSQICHNILGIQISQLNYSEARIHENIKSLAIIGRAYDQEENYWIKVLLKVIIGNSIKIILFEKNAFRKIKSLYSGFKEGLEFDLKQLDNNRLQFSRSLDN